MEFCVPTLAAAGVPPRWPVLALNVAHAGLLQITKRSGRLLGFDTMGVKE
jgi:hypothetical protein